MEIEKRIAELNKELPALLEKFELTLVCETSINKGLIVGKVVAVDSPKVKEAAPAPTKEDKKPKDAKEEQQA